MLSLSRMALRSLARFALPLVLFVGAASVAGCRPRREPLYARASISTERIHVRVSDAHVRGRRVYIKTWVHNQSGRPMVVHRDDLALRLADGTVIPATSGRRSRRPIVIAPGRSRNVKVGFRAPEGADVASSSLVMNGIQLGAGSPRSLGEIALSKGRSTFVLRPARSQDESDEVVESDVDEEPAPPGPQPTDDADEDDDADEEEVESDDGSWQIGAG